MAGEALQAEIKEQFEAVQKSIADQRKVFEAKVEAIAAGKSTADFDEKLSRISETLERQEKAQKAAEKALEKERLKLAADQEEFKLAQQEAERKLEARVNRIALGLGGGIGHEADLRNEVLAKKAYDTYLRKGAEGLSADEKKVMLVSNDTTGGYLAPPTLEGSIIKAAVLFSPMRDLVQVTTIGTSELKIPKRTGTASATRMAENGTRAETTNPTWGQVTIPTPEMYAEARISKQNLEDSAYNLDAELTAEFAEQFGVLEGYEVINGTGVGQCLGILSANAGGVGVAVDFTKSGGASSIAGASGSEADGLVNMFHAVKSAYAQQGRWALNRASLGKVRLLKDTAGQYLWQAGIANGAPPSILGMPYTECPDMPNEGSNTFPIAFGDWKRAYRLVERLGMEITRDPYTVPGFVKFSARRRVGGQPVLVEAIRLLKCAT